MADQNEETTKTEGASPAPIEPSKTNEPAPTGTVPAENSRLQKIREVAGRIGEKFKIGRGRPRKDGAPKASDKIITADGEAIPATAEPTRALAVQSDSPSPSQMLLHRCIIGGAKGALAAGIGWIKSLARKAGFEKPYIDRLAEQAKPEPDALAEFSESLDLVLKKYNVNTEYAPEASLLIATGRLGAPLAMILLELRAEIKRRREAEETAK